MKTLELLNRSLTKAEKALQRAAYARRSLPPGSSRARVTTANARWTSAAEERDRIAKQIRELEGKQ